MKLTVLASIIALVLATEEAPKKYAEIQQLIADAKAATNLDERAALEAQLNGQISLLEIGKNSKRLNSIWNHKTEGCDVTKLVKDFQNGPSTENCSALADAAALIKACNESTTKGGSAICGDRLKAICTHFKKVEQDLKKNAAEYESKENDRTKMNKFYDILKPLVDSEACGDGLKVAAKEYEAAVLKVAKAYADSLSEVKVKEAIQEYCQANETDKEAKSKVLDEMIDAFDAVDEDGYAAQRELISKLKSQIEEAVKVSDLIDKYDGDHEAKVKAKAAILAAKTILNANSDCFSEEKKLINEWEESVTAVVDVDALGDAYKTDPSGANVKALEDAKAALELANGLNGADHSEAIAKIEDLLKITVDTAEDLNGTKEDLNDDKKEEPEKPKTAEAELEGKSVEELVQQFGAATEQEAKLAIKKILLKKKKDCAEDSEDHKAIVAWEKTIKAPTIDDKLKEKTSEELKALKEQLELADGVNDHKVEESLSKVNALIPKPASDAVKSAHQLIEAFEKAAEDKKEAAKTAMEDALKVMTIEQIQALQPDDEFKGMSVLKQWNDLTKHEWTFAEYEAMGLKAFSASDRKAHIEQHDYVHYFKSQFCHLIAKHDPTGKKQVKPVYETKDKIKCTNDDECSKIQKECTKSASSVLSSMLSLTVAFAVLALLQ